jgi:hypothetical protein
MAGSPANSPFLPGRQAAVSIDVPVRPAAWAASAAQDAVRRLNVNRCQVLCQELVRDCPLATAEMAPQVALWECWALPPRDALRKVAFHLDLEAAAEWVSVRLALRSVVQWVPRVESVLAPMEISAGGQSAQQALQPAERQPAKLVEARQVLSER